MIMHIFLIYFHTSLFTELIKANSNNTVTDSEYETVVANWLRRGNTRLSRSNSK